MNGTATAHRLDRKQLYWIHQYKRWAGLTDPEYRGLLTRAAGVRSAADLDNRGFDRVMPALESALWHRVDEGLVPEPEHDGRLARDYWRRRAPAKGMCNTRLRWEVLQFWAQLVEMLPPDSRHDRYLAGILAKSAGSGDGADLLDPSGSIAWERVPSRSAWLTVEALKDRIAHAITQEGLPF